MSKLGLNLLILAVLIVGVFTVIGLHTHIDGWHWQATISFGEGPEQQLANAIPSAALKHVSSVSAVCTPEAGCENIISAPPLPKHKPRVPPVSGIQLPGSANE